ncbi:MAG TPA: TonB-dependent receptor, partial [Usitatibacter sp.]
VPLDDQLVFAGGTLEQCRAQWEWTVSQRTFVTAAVERNRTHNLVSPLDGVQNTNADVTNLDRLRNRALTPPPKPDSLEDTPVYGEGIVKRAGLAIERIVTAQVAARAQYAYTDSENTNPALSGRSIPYLPRHQANLGATWAPGWHAFITAQAVYRSRRFADELNVSPLPAGWDAQLNVFIESPDKRWSVEAYGMNLLKKESSDVFGIVVSYRY